MCSELARIFGISRLDLNISTDKKALVYMVDGKSYRGSEQGGGIMQFVIVAANVLVKSPSILLIDEPELNLHASLQGQFLALLARYVAGPVIFSTHSLGLARSAADRLLVVAGDDFGRARASDYLATPSLSSILGELGYGGLNDLAYKAVLLVEGVADVRLFQELLSKFGVRHEVVIVPLGGDDLANGRRDIELAELKRLSELIFAVVDSEKTSPQASVAPRRLAFQRNCHAQGIECHVLERRAIENYLDQDVARHVLNVPHAVAFGEFDKCGPDWSWSKEKNWRIMERMSLPSIEGTDLASFARKVAESISYS